MDDKKHGDWENLMKRHLHPNTKIDLVQQNKTNAEV